jgi:hypothetical protein
MTELVDFAPDRVDLVKEGANGIPRFLIAKSAGGGGLVPAEVVRELIGKQADSPAPEPADDGQVTVKGSPAAIAKLIHAAARRVDDEVAKAQLEYEAIVKAKYNAKDLKRMAGNGQAMPDESYPVADEEDLHNAIRAVGRGGSSHNAIRRHIIARARSLGKSSMIPDNWASDGSLKEKVSKDMADMGPDLDEGVDGMDPTVPLAAPDEDKPGDPTDPGSPAWEAIDAATAQKWTSIAVRLKNALCIMAERELLEAAAGDGEDALAAFDLEDAKCAVDFVIDVLAGFAVDEQAEADLGGEAMDAIGKSAASDPDPAAVAAIRKALDSDKLPAALTTIETFDAVIAKAGRVLSAVNEAHIREAAGRLNTVLAALPQAPQTDDSGQPVAKQEGAADMADTDTQTAAAPDAPVVKADADAQARNTGPVRAGGTTGLGEPRQTGPDGALPGDGPQKAQPGDVPDRQVVKAAAVGVFGPGRRFLGLTDPSAILTDIAKADGDGKKAMCVVYNQDGALIGIVDPDDITPVSNSEAKADEAPADGGDAAPADDMTPAPPGEVGTPAGAVDDDDTVAKAAVPGNEDSDDTPITVTRNVLKSIAQEAAAAALAALAPAQDVAKSADVAGVSEEVAALKARLEVVEKHPAAPGAFLNGQLPPEGAVPPPRPSQLRGQDQTAGPQPIDVSKALARKAELYGARDATEQNQLAQSMQGDAIAALQALHARGPAR